MREVVSRVGIQPPWHCAEHRVAVGFLWSPGARVSCFVPVSARNLNLKVLNVF